MLQRDDRQLDAGKPSDLARPLARRDHDVLGPDVARGGRHGPAAALADELRHARVTEYGRATVDGSLCECVRQARRIDVPVGRKVGGREDAVRPREREQLERPFGRDDLERHAHVLGDPPHVLELVQPVAGRADPDAAALVEVDRESRLLLECPVQLDRRPEQLHQVVALDELRAEAGGMPRRPTRQLVRLHESDVTPAEPREVVERRDPSDTAAHDDDARLGDHGSSSLTRATLLPMRRRRAHRVDLGTVERHYILYRWRKLRVARDHLRGPDAVVREGRGEVGHDGRLSRPDETEDRSHAHGYCERAPLLRLRG